MTRINMSKESSFCYTYKVEMIIQVLAHDEASAREFLNQTGGYKASTEVTLLDSVEVYKDPTE